MRFSHIALFALPALAAASAIMPRNGHGHGGGGGGQSCSTGSNECCNQTFTATQITPTLAIILALIGVNVGDITALVGVGCVSVLGGGCSQQNVCCQNVNTQQLIGINCSPIIL